MTDKQTLLALAERVEKAEGADCDIDRDIAPLLGIRVVDEGHPLGRCYYDEHGHAVPLPLITASIGAAMTLVDAEAYWQVGHDGEGRDPSMFAARVFDPMTMKQPCTSVAETAPLALTAAALRARAGAMP